MNDGSDPLAELARQARLTGDRLKSLSSARLEPHRDQVLRVMDQLVAATRTPRPELPVLRSHGWGDQIVVLARDLADEARENDDIELEPVIVQLVELRRAFDTSL